jgi:hypothetical protein
MTNAVTSDANPAAMWAIMKATMMPGKHTRIPTGVA